MIDFKKIYEKIVEEDAVVAAGDAGAGEVVSNSAVDTDLTSQKGISADDVLGKCDHHCDGYLGSKCFHVPKNALGKGKMLRRWEEIYGGAGKKKKKNPYEKGMQIVSEDDSEISRLDADAFFDIIIKYYGIDVDNLYDVVAAVKILNTDRVFVKFKAAIRSRRPLSYFIEVRFADGKL